MRKPATNLSKNISEKKLAELKENANGILADARRNLINRLPFVGSVAMSLDLIPVRDERIATAATDGKRMFFDIAFLSTLKPEEVVFVIAHETYHCVLLHFIRQGGRQNIQWNYATDIEANNMLIADGLSMPKDGLSSKKFGYDAGLSAEDYYEMLKDNSNSNNDDSQMHDDNGSSSQSGNDDGSMNGQFDKHIYQDSHSNDEKITGDKADKYGSIGTDPDYTPHVEENAIEKMREIVLSAAQQVERSRGELPGHIKGIVNKLLTPELPWKEILAQFCTKTVNDKSSWTRPNRRFVSSRVYLPSKSGEKINLGVVIDTSGSCQNDLNKFLSEVNSIVKQFDYSLHLIQCDWDIQRIDEYDTETPLDLENTKFEVCGGGGTYLTPGLKYFEQNDIDVDAIVCFTDAEIESIPEDFSSTPIMWVITGKSKAENICCGEKAWFKD